MIKIERSYPAPASLAIEKRKASGSYSMPDVVEALKRDFNNKCYICEMGDLQDPQIEHRLPHHNGKDRDRKFDWDNLFWSCVHCNNVKSNKKYDEGIIDCCKVNPEGLILLSVSGGKVTVTAKCNAEDDEIRNTVMLLDEVFNKDNTGMRTVKTQERYNLLQKEMNRLYDNLSKYRIAGTEEKPFYYRTLKGLLNRSSAFAGFKREYIRMNREMYPELLNLLY